MVAGIHNYRRHTAKIPCHTSTSNPPTNPSSNYYAELQEYDSIGAAHEGAVRTAFQNLLQHYCRQADLILVCEKTHYTPEKRRITPDGEVVDTFGLPYGYWEAKDTQDDLYVEADKKFAAGYPIQKYRLPVADTRAPLSTRAAAAGLRHHRTEKPRQRSPEASLRIRKRTSRRGIPLSRNSRRPYRNSARN